MKQHTTPKQLNELSEKGRENFRKHFWKVFDGDLLVYGDYKNGKIDKKIVVFSYGMIPADEESFGYKLLSIGQMIEFLEDGENKGLIDIGLHEIDNCNDICDILWKATKKVLEK